MINKSYFGINRINSFMPRDVSKNEEPNQMRQNAASDQVYTTCKRNRFTSILKNIKLIKIISPRNNFFCFKVAPVNSERILCKNYLLSSQISYPTRNYIT